MDINELKTRIKEGRISGAYILAGEEDYLVRHYLGELRRAANIDEAFAVFNNPVYDGERVDFAALFEDIKSPPMMADFKLIEWRHADLASMKEGDFSLLEELFGLVSEYPYAVLVITADGEGVDFGTPKRPSAFIKRFGKLANILRFDKSTDAQLYGWLKRHFDSQGISVSLDTLKALVFRSGHSMDVLKNEVDKLSALAGARGIAEISPREVEEAASSTPECDTYAFSNAVTERNKQKAFLALEEMKIKRVEPAIIMGMLARTFSELLVVAGYLEEGLGLGDIENTLKMNSYKAKICIGAVKRYGIEALCECVERLAEADASSKYGGVSGYTAIELFISRNI